MEEFFHPLVHLHWNRLLNLLLKQKSLNCLSPVSFCFICSFHFQINYWKSLSSHTSCLHSVTSHSLCRPLQLTWNLPDAQKPLMLRSCLTTEYLSVFFLLWSISSIWYIFNQLICLWDTIFLSLLFYVCSHSLFLLHRLSTAILQGSVENSFFCFPFEQTFLCHLYF